MSFFKKREGEKHHRAKIRLGALFQSQMGYDAFFEVPSIEIVEYYDQPVTYYFDVLLGIKGYRNYEYRGFIIAEVDGRVGHRTLNTDNKTTKRDRHFFNKYGIPTARFATEDLIGSKSIDDSIIIKEMEYQVPGYIVEDSYKPHYCFACQSFGKSKGYCDKCNTKVGGGFHVRMSPGSSSKMAGPSMAAPHFSQQEKPQSFNTKNYQRKTIPLPPEKKYKMCTWCGHSFHKHSFSGCSQCSRCVTGIIHSSDKKDT